MSIQSIRVQKHYEDHQEQLDLERERKKLRPNENMLDGMSKTIIYPFWCDVCKQDFTARARMFKHRLHGDWIATYRCKCPDCENDCVRYITHKDHDPYYNKSLSVRKQRNEYSSDVLQPDDYGYKTHYGNPWEEFDKRMEMENERLRGRQRDMGFNLN